MKKFFRIAVLLVFAFQSFAVSQPAQARSPKIPRGFEINSSHHIDGCTYQLRVVLYEYTKGNGDLGIELDSPCLSGTGTFWVEVERNEFNINGSLKAAALRATIPDPSSGAPRVVTDLRLKSVDNKPSTFMNQAYVTGTVTFTGLGLTFTFQGEPVSGIWYGT